LQQGIAEKVAAAGREAVGMERTAAFAAEKLFGRKIEFKR